MAIAPYSDMIDQLRNQSRLDPIRQSAESPIVSMLRRMRSLHPMAPPKPHLIALHLALKPHKIKIKSK